MGKKGMKRSRLEESDDEDSEQKNEILMELEAARQVMLEQQKELKENSQRKFIFDKAGLLAKIEEMGISALPWPETLEVAEVPLVLKDVHDDLEREMSFYTNILEGVKSARKKLLELHVPYQRPEDFFAEMIKSDSHMDKIKDKLIFEKKKMEAFEQRRQRDEQRKFSKAVMSEKQKDRAAAKKETLDKVAQWRKKSKGRGVGPAADDDGIENLLGPSGGGKGGKGGKFKSRKRELLDKKFGHGGPNRLKKRATKQSLNDFRDFNKGSNTHRKGKKNQGANRPGKASRAKKRQNFKK